MQSIINDPAFKGRPVPESIEKTITDATSHIADSEEAEQERHRIRRFISITDQIISPIDIPHTYDYHSLVYSAYLSNLPLHLGKIPKILQRMINGNNNTLDVLEECFKTVSTHFDEMKQANPSATFADVAEFIYPNLFQLPGFMYQALLVKKLAEDNQVVKAIVGIHQATPLFDMIKAGDLLPAADFDEILCFPERMKGRLCGQFNRKVRITRCSPRGKYLEQILYQ